MAIIVNDGAQNHTLADKEAKTILGLEFVGNGYGKDDSLDKGLPTWNQKNIKNFITLALLIAQKIGISDIIDSLTSSDSQKPLSAKQGKVLLDTFANYYTKAQTNTQIDTRINSLIGIAPANLDTLKEISDALADDDNQISAVLNSLSQKVSKTDIVDDLFTTDSTKPLSAKMGNFLMGNKLSISDLPTAIANISGAVGYYNKNSIDNLLLGYQSKSSPVLGSPIPVSFVSASDSSGLVCNNADLRLVSDSHLGAVYEFTFDVEFDCTSSSPSCILGFVSSQSLPLCECIEVPEQSFLFSKRDSAPVKTTYVYPYSSGYVPNTFELIVGMTNGVGHYRICGSVLLYLDKVV